MRIFFLWIILFIGIHASCSEKTFESSGMQFQLQAEATGLDIPWSFAFIPPAGDLLITEKDGRILWHKKGGRPNQWTEVQGAPEVYDGGQGGLMDVVLHPQFQKTPWVYLTYSISDKGKKTTRVSRALWDQGKLKNLEILFTARPSFRQSIHFGSRLVFDNQGYIFFSIGDRNNRDLAQSLSTHNGKIMRLHEDGRIPEDNPFYNNENALQEIWSYGHRNPQGLAFKGKELWSHEHGPRGGDEVNLILKGKNYGWPVVTYGREYIGGSIGEGFSKKGMEDSKKHYTPSIAPSGLMYYEGDRYLPWKGSFLLGSLVFQALYRVSSVDFSKEEKFSVNKRVRDVRIGPDGWIYIAVENGAILKAAPL